MNNAKICKLRLIELLGLEYDRYYSLDEAVHIVSGEVERLRKENVSLLTQLGEKTNHIAKLNMLLRKRGIDHVKFNPKETLDQFEENASSVSQR